MTFSDGSSGAGITPIVSSNAEVVLGFNSAKYFSSLEFNGGILDVTTGGAAVPPSQFGYSDGTYSPVSGDGAIQQALHDGANFDGGYWNGSNGIESSVANTDPSQLTAVGWIDNDVSNYDNWRGINLAAISGDLALISYTYYGDCLLQGDVTLQDLAIIQNSIAHPPAHPTWSDGDLNYDGVVNSSDLALFYLAYDADLPPLNFVAVPEPRTVSLLVACMAVVIGAAGFRVVRKQA